MRASQRAIRALLLLAACGLSAHRTACAQPPSAPAPTAARATCTGDALDFRLVHNLFSASAAPGHLLTILIHNRGLIPCILPPANLDLFATRQSPVSQTRSIDYPGPIQQPTDRWSLEPGQFAHIVLAWSTAPERVPNHADCTTEESLVLRGPATPWLTVRSFYIRPCGEVWVSPYRPGTYVPNEPILQQWMDTYQLQLTAVVPTFEPIFLAPQQSPTFNLTSLSPVRYLKGPAGSGYTGVFTLWLLGHTACPYYSLSKRETNGETLVQLNPCSDVTPATPDLPTALFEVGLSNNHLLPLRPGRVEYTVETYALEPKPRVDSSRLSLEIRDPATPMLPTIDTKLQPCVASQLAVAPTAVDLGTHWTKARSYADDEKQWHDGRAFNLTNTSASACLLGGTPDLKFRNPPEVTTGTLTMEVCRNCDNPIFAARESHWIELKPLETAHFLVSRTVLDSRYQSLCSIIGGLDLMQSGRPIYLPFEAASCAPINVSAWREGLYDNDPLNLVYAPAQPQLTNAATIPEQCAQAITADTGQPIFPFTGNHSNWGISTQPIAYGQPVPLNLWIDNSTDQPIPILSCSDLELFTIRSINIFDSAGHRLLSKSDIQAGQTNAPARLGCGLNSAISIPAHSCAHGSFTQPSNDFVKDLRRLYNLPPGIYNVVPAVRTDSFPSLTLTITPE
jgi:hypothetical protein